jgi:Glycine zipper
MEAKRISQTQLDKQTVIKSSGRTVWRYAAGVLALVMALSLAGCYGPPLSTRDKGTIIGGAVGLGSGALVGSAVGSPAAGAAIGGLLGAGSGYLIGNAMQNQGYWNGYGGHGHGGSWRHGDHDDDD